MPRVEISVFINAPRGRVVAIARDFARFPEFMDEVKSLAVVEANEDKSRVVTEWVAIIKQFRLTVKWTQEDVWDEAKQADRFSQLKGDYDSMSGEWRFIEREGGTEIQSVVDYEYNVPLLGPLVQKVIYAVVKGNIQASLHAIKREAEGS